MFLCSYALINLNDLVTALELGSCKEVLSKENFHLISSYHIMLFVSNEIL